MARLGLAIGSRGRRAATAAAAACVCTALGSLAFAAATISLREDFATSGVVRTNGDIVFAGGLTWRRENNPNGVFELLSNGVLRLTVQKGAYEKALNGEGDLYDRSEMRESRDAYRPPGADVWYKLSMRVPDGTPVEDTRLVVVQVKTPFAAYEDASPVIALRLERGVLFATAEHLMTTPEQRARIVPAQITPGREPRCPDGHALGALHDDPAPQVRVLLATGPDGLPPRRTGEYVVCTPFAMVERIGTLPAVGNGWHDVVIGLKTGLDGWLALAVDGKAVAKAAGPFGDGSPKGQQYLKFGPYRDKSDSTLSVDFARFRRAASAPELAD